MRLILLCTFGLLLTSASAGCAGMYSKTRPVEPTPYQSERSADAVIEQEQALRAVRPQVQYYDSGYRMDH